jgi:hypothetical protein
MNVAMYMETSYIYLDNIVISYFVELLQVINVFNVKSKHFVTLI